MNVKSMQEDLLPPIVAIGASAGGLEALYAFFQNLSSSTGCCFIVVQHLSPDFKSMMGEILSNHTQMPVVRVDGRTDLVANHIYLISPGTDLICKGNSLDVIERSPSGKAHLPIDILFESIAVHHTERVIGIVLSGTGSDGTKGSRVIKENGGIVLVQSLDSCRFDGMPRSAISAGVADRILRPEEMPEFIEHAFRGGKILIPALESPEIKSTLQKILFELNSRTGMDFTDYRQTTIIRRIERRMLICGCESLDDYLTHLKASPGEASDLSKDMLIGVTQFFRDRDFFSKLKLDVFPKLIKDSKEKETIRFWVVGCSTGEEAYSLAMILLDAMDQLGMQREIKIFATDIDQTAIQTAANGIYPETIRFNIEEELLEKFFNQNSDGDYVVSRRLRQSVMFAVHNVLSDPPFTKIDVVTCRNLLIYFQPHLQTKVLTYLDFSLKVDGVMGLGISESLGSLADRYAILDSKLKVFRKRSDLLARSILEESEPFLGYPPLHQRSRSQSVISPQRRLSELQVNRVLDTIVERNLPPCFIISEDLSLVYVFPSARKYLNVVVGKADFNVTRMLGKELSIALTTGVHRAISSSGEIEFSGIKAQINDQMSQVSLRIQRVSDPKAHPGIFAVYLIESKESKDEPSTPLSVDDETHDRIIEMEQQLTSTKQVLQSTIEELEATNEELQSANEELLSSNEELQSTNEELHSVNEELYTVNAEHQRKIQEVIDAKLDFEHLLSVSKIGAVFLDSQKRVRRFTTRVSKFINLVMHDIGRSIEDLAFFAEDKKIKGLLDQCLKSNQRQEMICRYDDKDFCIVVTPYVVSDGSEQSSDSDEPDGAVICIIER